MDVYEALYTTRAMRRVKPDPIPEEVQARILDAAIRAPSGGDSQAWRFLLVDDKAVISNLAPLYRECADRLFSQIYGERIEVAQAAPDEPENAQFLKMYRSAKHMGDHFEGYPLLLGGFIRGDRSGSSTFPAVWNAMLAARAEGVGSAITSLLGFERDRAFDIMGVPLDQGWQFACLVPMGYPTGRWGVAPRRPVHEVAFRNQWGEPLGFEIPGPLWPPAD
ncbi:MAG: nitroreductase [Gammaproteobacteria bacterium]|nr:nitroreductase [Gammaproteobacteria bacterium]